MTNDNNHYELVRRLVGDFESTRERIERLRKLGARGEDAAESLDDELRDEPLSIDVEVTIDVTLSTGGPANGIEFRVDKGRFGWEMLSARAWWQDWYTSKTYQPLDDDLASYLFEAWGIEGVGVSGHD